MLTTIDRGDFWMDRARRDAQLFGWAKSLRSKPLILRFVEETALDHTRSSASANAFPCLTIHWHRTGQGPIFAGFTISTRDHSADYSVQSFNRERTNGMALDGAATSRNRWENPTDPVPQGLDPMVAGSLLVEWIQPASAHVAAEAIPCLESGPRGPMWTRSRVDAILGGSKVVWHFDGDRPMSEFDSGPIDPPREPTSLFLSVNPNASGSMGHFIGFDGQLRSRALSDGHAFLSLGSLEQDPSLPQLIGWIRPTFSMATAPGHQLPRSGLAEEFVRRAKGELAAVLSTAEQHFEHIHVFWYLGTVEHVPAIADLVDRFDTATWHTHLFWDCVLDESDRRQRDRFAELIDPALELPSTEWSLGTRRHRDLIEAEFGLSRMLYFPAGPSVSLDDDTTESMFRAPSNDSALGPRLDSVFFPSNHSEGKNWDLSARACLELVAAETPTVDNAWIRMTGPAILAKRPTMCQLLLNEPNVSVLRGNLPDHRLLAAMAASLVVVLPYGSEWFRHRTSGLVTEATMVGTRVVCFEDTHLAEVVELVGHGEAVPLDRGVSGLVEAIGRQVEIAKSDGPIPVEARRRWFEITRWEKVYASALRPACQTLGAT